MLRTVVFLVLSLTILPPLRAQDNAVQETALTLESGQLYLVFDPRLRGAGENCELKLHQFNRHPLNPLIKPDQPWEGRRIQLYGTVLWEPDNGLFQTWYFAGDFLVCYATSRDGIHWDKPTLGLHELGGSKQNNVSSMGDGLPVVYRDPEASDPARRYVRWSLQVRDGDDGVKANYSIYRFFSPDGLRWTRERREPVLPGHPTRYRPRPPPAS